MEETLFRDLIGAAQAGCREAREALVQENLGLVRAVLKRFPVGGREWDDLFQTGCLGLVKAISRFDRTMGVRFSTYAVPMILGEIKQYVRGDHPIHIARSLAELGERVRKEEEKLRHAYGREPTIHELASRMKLSVTEIAEAMEARHPLVSLYDSGGEQDMPLWERIAASEEDRPDDVRRMLLAESLARLPKREQEIIRLRFWQDKTQAETARIMQLSQVHISRIERRVLAFLRKENQP